MFETTFVQERSVRAWAMPASVVLQTGLVGTLMLVPLMFFDALPPLTLSAKGYYLPLSPPPALGVSRAAGGGHLARRSMAPLFIAPRVTPRGIAEIHDDLPVPPQVGPLSGGVGGPPGVPEGVPFGTGTQLVRPAPPPVVETAPDVVQPKPTLPDRVRVGGVVRPPVLLRDVKPVYPPIARAARISGLVRLDAIIGRGGQIQSLRVLSGPPFLSAAALEAVRQWVYQPTLLNGDPVEVILQIDVNFTLSN